jgi:uncharacterized membrane protein HdeD (DUF308 family)
MNKLVKRGFSAYKIFLKNKVVASIMMLSSGVMMFIGAIQGKGNDVYSLPILITTLGTLLTLWAVFRLGYLKSEYDGFKGTEDQVKKREFFAQILEGLVYATVAGVGVFLLSNHEFTNKALNLMAGFFTTLNGVFNIFTIYKNRETKNLRWEIRLVLMVLELILGPFFLINSDGLDINAYIIMGLLTSVAGTLEIITVSTRENLKDTIKDGKDILKIMKTGKKDSDVDIEIDGLDEEDEEDED